ncbi:MAG: AMP-binding protein, partial [Rhodococcus sp.]|nr:AMP-binding protein [Rhodococcus sp. (in: high G+C Gram-positive bacteria)]
MNSESTLLRSLDPRIFDDHGAAVSFGEGATLSRADLFAAATAVADRIHGAQRVAVQAAARLETVVAVAGALIAGAAVVPIPPDSGPLERQHIIADSQAELILGDGPSDSSIPLIPIDIHARSATSYPEPSAAATALIMYTSGTTGAPKGVVLSRASIAADLDALAHVWNWTPEDTLVHGLPLFHVHGLILGVLGALRVGSPLIHTFRPTPDSYAAAGGSLYFGVPTVWSRVCGDPSAAAALRSARLLVSGSAPLPVPLFERMKSLTGLAPVERYGMSETLITVSTTHDGERRPGWVGHAVPGVRTRLRGENGQLSAHDGEQLGQLEVA